MHPPHPLSRLSCPTSVESGQPITYFLASNGHVVEGLGQTTPKAKCCHLPLMDGITAFKLLRADPVTEKIPEMAVSASAMTNERENILGAGFEGYQAKSINVKDFVEEVRRVLESGPDTKLNK